MGILKRSDVIRLRKINNSYFTSLLNKRENMLKVLLTKCYIKRWSVPACVFCFILRYCPPHSMIGQCWLLLNSLIVSYSSCIKSGHMAIPSIRSVLSSLPLSCSHYTLSFLRIPLRGHIFQRAFLDCPTPKPFPIPPPILRKRKNENKNTNKSYPFFLTNCMFSYSWSTYPIMLNFKILCH